MNTTTDKTTLKNIKGGAAPFLLLNSGRPEIGPVGQSSVLSRLKNFLPEIAQANEELPAEGQNAEAIQIENVAVESDTSTSDSDDSDSSSDSEAVDAESLNSASCVQFDVNLFKDPTPVEKGDHTIEDVSELPEGFRENEGTDNQEAKKIVEELS